MTFCKQCSLVILSLFVVGCGDDSPAEGPDAGRDLDAAESTDAALQTVELFIGASGDDAHGVTDSVAFDANEVRLGDLNGALTTAGLRFPGLDVPAGAEVRSAVVSVVSASMYEASLVVRIQGEARANPSGFEGRNPMDMAPLTGASVDWAVDVPWGYLERVESADLSAVVQELIDADDWTQGAPVALRLEVLSTDPAGDHRQIFAWDRDTAEAASLRVVFTAP